MQLLTQLAGSRTGLDAAALGRERWTPGCCAAAAQARSTSGCSHLWRAHTAALCRACCCAVRDGHAHRLKLILMCGQASKHAAMVPLLLSAKATANAADKAKALPLHRWAASCCCRELVTAADLGIKLQSLWSRQAGGRQGAGTGKVQAERKGPERAHATGSSCHLRARRLCAVPRLTRR